MYSNGAKLCYGESATVTETDMSEQERRLECLRLAISASPSQWGDHDVLARADAYWRFVEYAEAGPSSLVAADAPLEPPPGTRRM
jgi:hypothetical protein